MQVSLEPLRKPPQKLCRRGEGLWADSQGPATEGPRAKAHKKRLGQLQALLLGASAVCLDAMLERCEARSVTGRLMHFSLTSAIVRRHAAYISFVKAGAGAVEGTHACGPVFSAPKARVCESRPRKDGLVSATEPGEWRNHVLKAARGNGPVQNGVPTTLVVPWQL